MATRRARSVEDKLARYTEIIAAAKTVFDAGEIDEFTMDAVAAQLDLAKGTLYRYFPTREGLLLALAEDEYLGWFARVDAALTSVPTGDRMPALAQIFVDQLLAAPRFMRLAALVPSVLERNIPYETAMHYKTTVVARSRQTTTLVAQWLDITEDRAVQLLIHMQAAATGLYQAAHPAPIIVQVMADPSFPGRATDLRTELLHSANALVQAASSR
ncbi:MAG: ycdC [Ilumatobacteraceae bacterium]|nr:ycdC [Ilumatobacteraceae bacterium]